VGRGTPTPHTPRRLRRLASRRLRRLDHRTPLRNVWLRACSTGEGSPDYDGIDRRWETILRVGHCHTDGLQL